MAKCKIVYPENDIPSFKSCIKTLIDEYHAGKIDIADFDSRITAAIQSFDSTFYFDDKTDELLDQYIDDKSFDDLGIASIEITTDSPFFTVVKKKGEKKWKVSLAEALANCKRVTITQKWESDDALRIECLLKFDKRANSLDQFVNAGVKLKEKMVEAKKKRK